MESLLLFRRALSSPTMCRFIPALSVPSISVPSISEISQISTKCDNDLIETAVNNGLYGELLNEFAHNHERALIGEGLFVA